MHPMLMRFLAWALDQPVHGLWCFACGMTATLDISLFSCINSIIAPLHRFVNEFVHSKCRISGSEFVFIEFRNELRIILTFLMWSNEWHFVFTQNKHKVKSCIFHSAASGAHTHIHHVHCALIEDQFRTSAEYRKIPQLIIVFKSISRRPPFVWAEISLSISFYLSHLWTSSGDVKMANKCDWIFF